MMRTQWSGLIFENDRLST